MRSFPGEKDHQFLQEPWILVLAQSVETFFMFSISYMTTVQYWWNLGILLDKAKENISKRLRFGDTCFTSLEKIRGNLFTRHMKNRNHVYKDSINLLSVIIILGKTFHGGETFFYDGTNMNYIGKRAHVLNHSHVLIRVPGTQSCITSLKVIRAKPQSMTKKYHKVRPLNRPR